MKQLLFLACLFVSGMITAQREEHSYTVYFDHDRTELTLQSSRVQDSILSLLRDVPENYVLTIAGHTDVTGTGLYNQRLSKKRTEAVARIFEKEGFAKEQISLSWHAAQQPAVKEESVRGYARNRRVDVSIVHIAGVAFVPAGEPDMEAITGLRLPRAIQRINPCIDNQLRFDSGTSLFIPANSFKDAGCGELDIVYTEMHNPIDFMLGGIPMSISGNNGAKHFHSAGMFRFQAFRSETEFPVSEEAEIRFSFKASVAPDSFGMFGFDNRTETWTQLASQPVAAGTSFEGNHIGEYRDIPNPFCERGVVRIVLSGREIAALLDEACLHLKRSAQTVKLTPDPEAGCPALYRAVQYRLAAVAQQGKPSSFYFSAVNEQFLEQEALSSIPIKINGLRLMRNEKEIYLNNLRFSGGKIRRKGYVYIPADFRHRWGRAHVLPARTASMDGSSSARFALAYHIPRDISKQQLRQASIQLREVQRYNAYYWKQNRIMETVFSRNRNQPAQRNYMYNPTGTAASYIALNFIASKLVPGISFGTILNFEYFMEQLSGNREYYIALFDSVAKDPRACSRLLNEMNRGNDAPVFTFGSDNVISGVIKGVSVFNADKLLKMHNTEELLARYVTEDGKPVRAKTAYYITSRINGLIRYDGFLGSPGKFTYSTKGANRLVLVDIENNIYLVDRNAFAAAVAKNKHKAVFTVKPLEKNTPREEWEKQLAAR